jgi:hypothetical protein
MRFPYSVVCGIFVFPVAADEDMTPSRSISTFRRAMKLFATISGRRDYTDPGEKFENVTLILFQPVVKGRPKPWAKLFDARTEREMTEREYFLMVRDIYNYRNPHTIIGDEDNDNGERG